MPRNLSCRSALAFCGLLVLSLISSVCVGQTATTQPAATQPTGQAGADQPAITVGGRSLTKGSLSRALQDVPSFDRSQRTEQLLAQFTQFGLTAGYVNSKELPVDKKEFERRVDNLRIQLALEGHIRKYITPDKIKTYISEHANFFDGTKVRASQIVIKVPLYASSEKQRAAHQKLKDITAQIKAGRISFRDAAKANSDDLMMREYGGDVGEFGFVGEKALIFAIASFSTPVGEVSDVIRTPVGWHVVQVTSVTPGDGKPKPWKQPRQGGRVISPEAIAAESVKATILHEILLTAIEPGQVVNYIAEK